jgi:methionyl-tRNA formyltransferase
LFEKLSILTAETIHHTIKNFENIKSVKQDDNKATKSVIIKKEFGKIDFKNESMIEIDRKVRAYTSWPSAYIDLNENEKLKIWDVDIVEDNVDLLNAKKLLDNVYILNDKIYAKCKDGIVKINQVQKSGKNKMSAKDFINGIKF